MTDEEQGEKFFIAFHDPWTPRASPPWPWTQWTLWFGSEDQRDPYLIFTEDLPRLSRQSVECVGIVHLLSAHLPSNYMEFHKVLSSFVIQQKLFYLRKESRVLPSLWWFGEK